MTTPALTARVHSRILDSDHPGVRLWYFGRWLNADGSGKVEFTVQQVCSLFGVGKATVYRWLERGEGMFWRRNRQERGHIELWLIGICQVCKNLQLGLHKNVLGAIADVPLSAISTRFGAKALATQLDTIQAQRQGWWAANANTTSNSRKFILEPGERVACAVSTRANGNADGEAKPIQKYALVNNEWTIPGTTVANIRKHTDWKCDRTIQRRLSASERIAHGLEPIDKLRVAEEITDPDLMARLTESSAGYIVENNRVYKYLGFTNFKFWALKHNIYAEDFCLLGLRRLRGKINRFLKSE